MSAVLSATDNGLLTTDKLLLEPQRQATAEESWKADVRAAEDGLEVVEEQLVRQILNVEL